MRTDADDVQTTCSAVGELSRARKQRQKLEGRGTHGIPPRRPQEQASAYQRPNRHRGLRSSARFRLPLLALGHAATSSPDNGSRRCQEWCRWPILHLLETCPVALCAAPSLGVPAMLTVCPSLACTLFPYSGAAKERAPAMPCHPCRWARLAPNCPLAQP